MKIPESEIEHSSNLTHCSDAVGSLTHCVTRELQSFSTFDKEDSPWRAYKSKYFWIFPFHPPFMLQDFEFNSFGWTSCIIFYWIYNICLLYSQFGSLVVSYKNEHNLIITSSNPSLWYLPKEIEKLCPYENLHINVLVTTAKTWKQPWHSSVGEWINCVIINRQWNIIQLKGNELLSH